MKKIRRFAVKKTYTKEKLLDDLGAVLLDENGNDIERDVWTDVGPRAIEIEGNQKLPNGWYIFNAVVDDSIAYFTPSFSNGEVIFTPDPAKETAEKDKIDKANAARISLAAKLNTTTVKIKDLKDLGII